MVQKATAAVLLPMLEARPSLCERFMQWQCVRLAQRFIASPLRSAIDAALRADSSDSSVMRAV